MPLRIAALLLLVGLVNALPVPTRGDDGAPGPDLDAVLAAGRDLWGEEAMGRPDGPSYEVFARLLPPLRHVNAAFRHYPIVLSAPLAPEKARLVSDGGAINARAGTATWREVGTPVTFRVGDDGQPFGADLRRLDGPRYERGYLPIVRTAYSHDGAIYEQEVFAAVEAPYAEHAVVFVRFALGDGQRGRVDVRVDAGTPPEAADGTLRDPQGRVLVAFDRAWTWDAAHGRLTAVLGPGGPATLAVSTRPMPPPALPSASATLYDEQRRRCVEAWEAILRRGTRFDVPEPVVNHAWRALIVGSLMIAAGDQPHYSAGNAYQRPYEAECGDVVRALLLYGQQDEARRMIPPLLGYRQEGLAFHDAGFKLQLLAHAYWLTRDAELVRGHRERWAAEVGRIRAGRDRATGLLPRENYCGDVATQVVSLSSNANAWRGLRDLAAVLADLGEADEAGRLAREARDFRRAILEAVGRAERRDVDPPFVPIALSGEEPPSERLTATRLGSYWTLMAPYVLGSGVLDPPRERAILDTLQQRGGLCLGMVRFHQHSGLFANEDAVDDLYSLRYALTLLRRDEPERALVSFYGKLAQGLTRETFIGAEGTGLRPLDETGRPMYLPPNAAGNAFFLWLLRDLLVQDQDADDDGVPETLRLLFATPRPWLRDGGQITIERAPTAFGPVSLKVSSPLGRGEVLVELDAPPRPPARTLLRLRPPDGGRVTSALLGQRRLPVDERGTVDLSGQRGRVSIRFGVQR